MSSRSILPMLFAGAGVTLARLFGALRSRNAERRAEAEQLLAEAEDALLFGSAAEAAPRLAAAERKIGSMDPAGTRLMRARLRLALGGVARASGRNDEARDFF